MDFWGFWFDVGVSLGFKVLGSGGEKKSMFWASDGFEANSPQPLQEDLKPSLKPKLP